MFDIAVIPGVASYKDNSDEMFDRLFLEFENGESISIIRGDYSYGGNLGLFEIMPSNSEALGIGDEVMGYLTKEKVIEYATKLSNL